MRILVDANLFLDIALRRPGLHTNSRLAPKKCGGKGAVVMIAWHTLSNVFYILRRARGRERAVKFLRAILGVAQVATVDHEAALAAFTYGLNDFEDALQLAAAEAGRATVILTRNKSDFGTPAGILVMTPEEFLQFTPQ
jgi:predicted nucleic acid-binding protein